MHTTTCNATVTTAEAADLGALIARLAAHGCKVPHECATHAAWKLGADQ